MEKICFIIAGPNGAGKTTFAQDFLPVEAGCLNYINADYIAHAFSPFAPENVQVLAGRLMLEEIKKCVSAGIPFAVETTLSGLSYKKKVLNWQSSGYAVVLYYFSLPSVEMAIDRVKYRVEHGGHDIPEADIRRRFERSKYNLENVFKTMVDSWVVFDTSSSEPKVIEESGYE